MLDSPQREQEDVWEVGPKNFRQTEKLLWLCAWLKTHITPLTIFAQHLASHARLCTGILERQKGLRGPPIRPHNYAEISRRILGFTLRKEEGQRCPALPPNPAYETSN